MKRLISFASVSLSLLVLGCAPEPPPQNTNYSSTVEFQDIYVPDRLIEIDVLPEGSQVINEIYVHNAGDRDLHIDEVALDYQSDDNWVLNEDTVPAVILPHEYAVIEVAYTAAGAVDTFAALDIFSDDPDEAEKTVAFIGRQASGGPDARVSSNILDWGFQFRGVEERKIIEIRNHGDEELWVTGVELVQSEAQAAFHIACPGQSLESCEWAENFEGLLLGEPILPGSAALLDIAFVPLNLQGVSAQLKIQTNDPLRPEFTIFLLGNGDSALNCSAPSITVTSPAEATLYQSWQEMVITARVFDQDQPPSSLYVEMFLGELLIENEFPDENGFVTFTIDIDEHNPELPSGLQPFTLKVSDGCPLYGYDAFVAAIDFPLSPADIDGDGFDENQGDCNDNNKAIFPQAFEVHDGFDNDCDGVIDEGTVVWDDDCDGYCESPPCLGQGPAPDLLTTCDGLAEDSAEQPDCNDSVQDLDDDGLADGASIFPGGEELLNFVDDNCDGSTDEGTSFFDDDGDGQTEVVGDCDDSNDEIFAGATEWCDDLDNDCDGAVDNDCLDQTAPPRVIGGVITSRFQVELGAKVEAQVLVISNDAALTYEWFTDIGTFDEPAEGGSMYWNAPENTPENQVYMGQFPTIMVTVTDSLGQSTQGFGNVLLSSEVTTSYAPVVQNTGNNSDCSQVSTRPTRLPAALLALGVFLGCVTRRRSR